MPPTTPDRKRGTHQERKGHKRGPPPQPLGPRIFARRPLPALPCRRDADRRGPGDHRPGSISGGAEGVGVRLWQLAKLIPGEPTPSPSQEGSKAERARQKPSSPGRGQGWLRRGRWNFFMANAPDWKEGYTDHFWTCSVYSSLGMSWMGLMNFGTAVSARMSWRSRRASVSNPAVVRSETLRFLISASTR